MQSDSESQKVVENHSKMQKKETNRRVCMV